MNLIRTTDQLAKFCNACAQHPYVAVDTEFMRDTTYYSQLCLVQIAAPGRGNELVAAVDTLDEKLSLDPIYDLFADANVTKVFHSARQDLEIFHLDRQIFPQPFFDTQIAAMACGYGEQVGYEALVRAIVGKSLDKSRQFSAWNRRPLSKKQLAYALDDVIHLRKIYEKLVDELRELDRLWWLEEEFAPLLRPELYSFDPADAWKRLKTRNTSPKYLAALRQVARFREEQAQSRNVPRNRVLNDKAVTEIASVRPNDLRALGRCRAIPQHLKKGEFAQGVIRAVHRANDMPNESQPAKPATKGPVIENHGMIDLLRALLKANAQRARVAPALIATAAELERIAGGDTHSRALFGWRNEIFGRDALRLTRGEIALASDKDGVQTIKIPQTRSNDTRQD